MRFLPDVRWVCFNVAITQETMWCGITAENIVLYRKLDLANWTLPSRTGMFAMKDAIVGESLIESTLINVRKESCTAACPVVM